MKKVILVILFVLSFCLIGSAFYLCYDATVKANRLLDSFNTYNFDLTKLSTGLYVDFSKDSNVFNKTKITEGKVFLDVNKTVKVISNIKINGMYCSLNDNEFKCSPFNNSKTSLISYGDNKEYKVGDSVTLYDGSFWHVINDSGKYSDYVTLFRDERVDINGDGIVLCTGSIIEPDRIPFDKNGLKKYDVTAEGNVGYYLENVYKKSLSNLNDIYEIRLIHTNELESVKERLGFKELTDEEITLMSNTTDELLESIFWMHDSPRPIERLAQIKITDEQYKKLMPSWLFNDLSGNYWVYPEKNKIGTAVWFGNGYTSNKPTTGYGLKPVLIVNKKDLV